MTTVRLKRKRKLATKNDNTEWLIEHPSLLAFSSSFALPAPAVSSASRVANHSPANISSSSSINLTTAASASSSTVVAALSGVMSSAVAVAPLSAPPVTNASVDSSSSAAAAPPPPPPAAASGSHRAVWSSHWMQKFLSVIVTHAVAIKEKRGMIVLWRDIHEQMVKFGAPFSKEQLRSKWHHAYDKFKDYKRKMELDSTYRPACEQYTQLNAAFGYNDATTTEMKEMRGIAAASSASASPHNFSSSSSLLSSVNSAIIEDDDSEPSDIEMNQQSKGASSPSRGLLSSSPHVSSALFVEHLYEMRNTLRSLDKNVSRIADAIERAVDIEIRKEKREAIQRRTRGTASD